MHSDTLQWRCPKRLKRQRYDKRLLPLLLKQAEHDSSVAELVFPDDVIEPGVLRGEYKLKFLGEFDGFSPYGMPEKFDAFEVEVSGWAVPAYRKHDPSAAYVICQLYSRKAVKL